MRCSLLLYWHTANTADSDACAEHDNGIIELDSMKQQQYSCVKEVSIAIAG